MGIRTGSGRFFPAPALKTTKTKAFGFAEGFIVGGFQNSRELFCFAKANENLQLEAKTKI